MKAVKEKYISFFLLVIFLLHFNDLVLELINLQIQSLMDKQEADKKELDDRLNEINTLKVDSQIIIKT